MLAALRQQFLPRFPTQGLQVVQLLKQSFRSTPYSASVSCFNQVLRCRGEYTFCPAQGMA
jgi:hypothetical protein